MTGLKKINKLITDKQYAEALAGLNDLNISLVSYDDFQQESTEIYNNFLACCPAEDETQAKVAIKCLNLLKRSCALGETFQNEIISKESFIIKIREILQDHQASESVRINCLQLLANLCVQNKSNQETILKEFKDFLLKSIEDNTSYTNASTMIVYNSFIYKSEIGLSAQELLEVLLANVEKNRTDQSEVPEFVSIFLEYLMCESNEIVDQYDKISNEKRILFLHYLTEYIRYDNRRNRPLTQDLFKHLLTNFKRKSDEILKTNEDTKMELGDVEEVFTLLALLSDCTCVEPYGSFLRQDGSLFLNMGCLLRLLQKRGKSEDENMFTPIQKVEEILKIRQGTSELNIEQEISFSLKSSLVKALANLSYKNKKNQNLAREMEIMSAILDCTNLDARNPFIQEWSILAIRNLCEENPENQQFIASLTKIGDAPNSSLTADFTTGTGGTIRISASSSSPATSTSRGQ
ncbi:ataxin-10 [Uranotaenia lowii]|uniref:ataxin-10 n=1 Tax=Uranotaenia lowii TaxID=190385 RepID=UPI002479395E|nr:ataxin-10 [Uranotaenia lowii]